MEWSFYRDCAVQQIWGRKCHCFIGEVKRSEICRRGTVIALYTVLVPAMYCSMHPESNYDEAYWW